MPELIDKDALRYIESDKDAYAEDWNDDYERGFCDAINKALKLPPIEPEVRHGRWIESQTDLICSACKWKYSDELPFMSNHGLDSMEEAFAHCPHCGARMDGGADND